MVNTRTGEILWSLKMSWCMWDVKRCHGPCWHCNSHVTYMPMLSVRVWSILHSPLSVWSPGQRSLTETTPLVPFPRLPPLQQWACPPPLQGVLGEEMRSTAGLSKSSPAYFCLEGEKSNNRISSHHSFLCRQDVLPRTWARFVRNLSLKPA